MGFKEKMIVDGYRQEALIMKKLRQRIRIWSVLVTMLLLLVSLTAATYAWFSSNRVVNTDKVRTRSSSEKLELQVSRAGGSSFQGAEEAPITQVNRTELTRLMPVSTADLQTFVYNQNTTDGDASGFQTVQDESYYYHGRVYLRALGEGQPEGSRMALYLDQGQESGGALASADSGLLLNAARLGLVPEDGTPVIFYLSDRQNSGSDRVSNTVLNGHRLAEGKVLNGTGGTIREANDPAVPLSGYTIEKNGQNITLPKQPLAYLEWNRIYSMDIYFYLEGCDPDCSDAVSFDGADIHLAFYGVLAE